ncbi:hypothetical protein NUACC21_51920 [Scytonema sp. NUACC21]
MSEYTYELPNEAAFMHTLCRYLANQGHMEISNALSRSQCEFSTSGSYTQVIWNTFWVSVHFQVSIDEFPTFTKEVQKILEESTKSLLPPNSGYLLQGITVVPFIEAPPDEQTPIVSSASLGSLGNVEHDGLRFRSKTETKIYEALKCAYVLFFPNATAILGGKNVKREPDFLVCKNGKWGILEVMGDRYHTPNTAMKDHDRARLFKDYGLTCIEFYDATRCYNYPDEVVKDFLQRLERS